MSNFTNEFLRWALGGDARHDPNRPQGKTRDLWGAVLALTATTGHGALIATPPSPLPVPFAVEIRFSADGVTYSTVSPVDDVQFAVIKTLDEMGGVIRERVNVARGDAFPYCQLAARSVSIAVESFTPGEFDGPRLWVSAVLVPTATYECPSVIAVATRTRLEGWGVTDGTVETHRYSIAEIESAVIPFPAFGASALRASLILCNDSDVDVYVGFGPSSANPPDQFGVIKLNPGDTYESPPGGYQGPVTLSVDTGSTDPNGYVLATQGLFTS